MVEVSLTSPVRAMELITILNRRHRFRGFVYQQAHSSADKKSIEVAVRPRKGSVAICSRCHLPAPGYDQLGERRFEFIPRMVKKLDFAQNKEQMAGWFRRRHVGVTSDSSGM
jgi:hypothetical protein